VDKKVKNVVFRKNAYFSKGILLAPETDFFSKRRGCTKRCFLVPAKPIHILFVISFRYCPFAIENLALKGLRFGTFGAIKVGWVFAYKQVMMTLNSD